MSVVFRQQTTIGKMCPHDASPQQPVLLLNGWQCGLFLQTGENSMALLWDLTAAQACLREM